MTRYSFCRVFVDVCFLHILVFFFFFFLLLTTRKVSRLYPTTLPRPISIQYSVMWRPTSKLVARSLIRPSPRPCPRALGPISVFVSRYTWYKCAAGREKQSKNLIEKTYCILEKALHVLQLHCTTCQSPRNGAYPLVRARYVKMSPARYNIEKK